MAESGIHDTMQTYRARQSDSLMQKTSLLDRIKYFLCSTKTLLWVSPAMLLRFFFLRTKQKQTHSLFRIKIKCLPELAGTLLCNGYYVYRREN